MEIHRSIYIYIIYLYIYICIDIYIYTYDIYIHMLRHVCTFLCVSCCLCFSVTCTSCLGPIQASKLCQLHPEDSLFLRLKPWAPDAGILENLLYTLSVPRKLPRISHKGLRARVGGP